MSNRGLFRNTLAGLLVWSAWLSLPVGAQPVTLPALLEAAGATHPSVLGALAETRASNFELEAAQRRRWPSVTATVESNTGNASSQANRALQVEQVIWDGGRNSALVEHAQAGLGRSEARVALQRHQIYLAVVGAWQVVLSTQGRLRAAQQSMALLRGYEAQMRRRVQAEVSPEIDLQFVAARILQTQVDMASAQMSLRSAIARLEQLTGLTGLTQRTAEMATTPDVVDRVALNRALAEADLPMLSAQAVAVQVAREEGRIARTQLSAKQAERWPTAYVRVAQPVGGATPYADNSATLFVGLRYAPGAGFATGAEAQALAERIGVSDQSVQTSQREALEALQTDRDEVLSTSDRLPFLESAVKGSQEVLESYSRQFIAGRKSWIDLLNAVRELLQNQYLFADTQASFTAAWSRFQLRMGHDAASLQ